MKIARQTFTGAYEVPGSGGEEGDVIESEEGLPAMDPHQGHTKQEELISQTVLRLDMESTASRKATMLTARALVDGILRHALQVGRRRSESTALNMP